MDKQQLGEQFMGTFQGAGYRFALVIARFNQGIGEALGRAAQDTLLRHGVVATDIDVAWVPGSFEIPLVAGRLAKSGRYAGIICLGAVIRGDTPHFDFVAAQAATGIARASWKSGVPIAFGVLTCDTSEQAAARAGGKAGNKGHDAAMVALEMAQLLRQLPPEVGV